MSEADRFMVGLRQPFSNENRFLGHRVTLYASGNDPFGGLPMNLSQKNDSTVERGQRRRRIQWQEIGRWLDPTAPGLRKSRCGQTDGSSESWRKQEAETLAVPSFAIEASPASEARCQNMPS